ncbi:hypothetical protein QQ020_25245 [Fulvivirgaceae bacterium BMA12]|uniref:Lipoprotein n=1 Tax=Agaribacillus aureus TaxID=3051825 RepID=A0ABT8LCA3_9BACT|nr:hypothetical protein [Fulvivirgaceae bacterium BMA12]
MKKLSRTLIQVTINMILIVCVFGCDLINDAKSIDFDVTLEDDFEINATEEDGTEYTQQIVLDATANADVRDNLSKIEKYQINKIEYTISGYSGSPENLFSGSIQFSDLANNTGQFSAALSNVNLSTAAAAGTQTLPVSENDLRELENILKNSNGLKVFMIGNFSQVPVNFTLNIKLTVKVEADATK